MTILRDLTGAPIPAARIRREFIEDFTPSLSASSFVQHGTGTSGSMWGSGPWYYRLTNATSGGLISLRSAWDINLGQYDQVELHAAGLHTNGGAGMAVGLGFKDSGNSRGVGVWHSPANTTAVCRRFGAGTSDTWVPYAWAGAEATRRRNLGLVVKPKTGDTYLVLDDQVVWHHRDPAMVLGAVRAVLDSSQSGTTGELRLAQVRLVAWHN